MKAAAFPGETQELLLIAMNPLRQGNKYPEYWTYPSKLGTFRIFTISFRAFSPMPNSMEFHPGKSYYFISTATANSLYARKGGYCRERNMKVGKIKM